MNCPDLSELETLAREDSSDASSAGLRSHLSQCGRCREHLSEVRANLELVSPLRRILGLHSPAAPPERVGPYRILREIGRGGMGIVYEGVQSNPRRVVAIKVLNAASAADPRRIRLFEREMRALARLAHPGIATILEAGATADGRAFLAMERVYGAPLLRFVEQAALSLRERVSLFRQVCEAIAYAHQRGVIHRDLKPGNILVQDDGARTATDSSADAVLPAAGATTGVAGDGRRQPKILDFGLAKLTEHDFDMTASLTEAGRVQGTIPYMSPEQVRGTPDGDVRSDVYALGVVLFELLTGRLPYVIDRASLPAAARTICETPPIRPSTLRRELRGDLETILLKALAKEPDRRYASAAALGEDLRRWLADEPIVARPATLGYQFAKFVRRQPLAAGLAALLVGVLLALGPAMLVLYGRAEQMRGHAEQESRDAITARDAARQETAKAAAVNRFLQDLLASADPEQTLGASLNMRQVLDDALAELDAGALAAEPEVEAAVRTTLGRSYHSLGLLPAAARCLERALALRESLHGDAHHAEVAESRRRLSELRLAQGRFGEARALAEQALTETQAAAPEDALAEALARGALANAELDLGRRDAARTQFEQALDCLRRRGAELPGEAAGLLAGLAEVAEQEDRYDDAHKARTALLQLVAQTHGERHPAYARALQAHGDGLEAVGRYGPAIEAYRRALSILEEALGAEHASVARCRHNLAVILHKTDDHAGAEALFREALVTLEARLGPDHAHVVAGHHCLAQTLMRLTRYDEAEERFRLAMELSRRTLGDAHPSVAGLQTSLAQCLGMRGRWDEAEAMHTAALESTRRIYGPRHSETALTIDHWANTRHARGDIDGAERGYREALAIYREIFEPDHPLLRNVLFNLTFLYFNDSRYELAEPLLREIIANHERSGEPSLECAHVLKSLGTVLALMNRPAEAEDWFERAIEMFGSFPDGARPMALALRELGEARLRCGDAIGAEAILRDALTRVNAQLPENHPLVAAAQSALGEALLDQGRPDEAEPLLRAALATVVEARGLEHLQTQRCLRQLLRLCRMTDQADEASELQSLVREVDPHRRSTHTHGDPPAMPN